ncbi:phage tail assembly protein [Aliivibrio wodanis]|uniref:phage tail assembly protein n=1 Tax=Aliivibrio wodanis TaxID=80852 RepID=UPI00406C9F55
MAQMTFNLKDGFKMGEETHFEVGLKELSSGDLIDAQMAAEKIVVQNGVAVAYTSDVMFGLEMLVRQVEYIGSFQGPLQIKELRKLSPGDLNELQKQTSLLDQMLMKEFEQRGRSKGAS